MSIEHRQRIYGRDERLRADLRSPVKISQHRSENLRFGDAHAHRLPARSHVDHPGFDFISHGDPATTHEKRFSQAAPPNRVAGAAGCVIHLDRWRAPTLSFGELALPIFERLVPRLGQAQARRSTDRASTARICYSETLENGRDAKARRLAGVLPMELGGFEPPTSWVRSKVVVQG